MLRAGTRRDRGEGVGEVTGLQNQPEEFGLPVILTPELLLP